MNTLTNIFIGRSGCGKGTQIEKLTEFLKEDLGQEVFHLEAGGRFRDFISKDGYSSSLANQIAEEGELQPEFLSIWAWGGELAEKFQEGQNLFIDGTPRRLIEAKILESAFDFYNINKVNIIYLNVSKDWAIKRMKGRGRHDDLEMSDIKNRLKWFDEEVVPVLDYYRAHRSHNFIEINGEQEIDKVHQDILRALDL
jgi:adenylate kinase family enzyme